MPQTAEQKWLLIKRVQPETHDITTLVAVPTRDEPAPAFVPGQYCQLSAVGSGEIPISISGDPSRKDRLVFTIRATGAASSALAARRAGELISMRGPLGNGWPLPQAAENDVLLIAGGMGLAALRPAIFAIRQNRSNFGRLTILCGARTPNDLIYTPELSTWDRMSRTNVLATVDQATQGWLGHIGPVTNLLDRVSIDASQTIAMICGPDGMMSAAAASLESRGLPSHKIFLSTVSGIVPANVHASARAVHTGLKGMLLQQPPSHSSHLAGTEIHGCC